MTTIATVGYGDIYPYTAMERIFVMFVMVVGVTFFTLLSGALASIMTAYDSQTLELKEKLFFLN
jgi:voltage-gated potassium channel